MLKKNVVAVKNTYQTEYPSNYVVIKINTA